MHQPSLESPTDQVLLHVIGQPRGITQQLSRNPRSSFSGLGWIGRWPRPKSNLWIISKHRPQCVGTAATAFRRATLTTALEELGVTLGMDAALGRGWDEEADEAEEAVDEEEAPVRPRTFHTSGTHSMI